MSFYRDRSLFVGLLFCLCFSGCGGTTVSSSAAKDEVAAADEREAAEQGMSVEEMEAAEEAEEAADEREN